MPTSHTIRNIQNIWRPDNYHGWGKRPPYFEGWYVKLVDPTEQHAYAVIPGIFLGEDPADSHCFVQTLAGNSGHSTYHRYPLDQFHADPDRFRVQVGPNYFSAQEIALDIAGPERTMQGVLRFDGTTPWPVRPLGPGIMDWYSFTPFMQCYHGVVSLDHTIRGVLAIDGVAVDFHGGRGYMEKDWGRSFPRAWVWMQTNHFQQPGRLSGTSLTASVATIPWLGTAFRGFIVGLWHRKMLFRFATYTGATIEHLSLDDAHVHWRMTGSTGPDNARYRLEIQAERASGGLLHGPYAGESAPTGESNAMLQRVMESLTAQVHVRLVRLGDGGQEILLFDDTGRHAGLEISGELGEILDG